MVREACVFREDEYEERSSFGKKKKKRESKCDLHTVYRNSLRTAWCLSDGPWLNPHAALPSPRVSQFSKIPMGH